MPEDARLTYASSGVDYGKLDALKRMAQAAARGTVENLPSSFADVPESVGESLRVLDAGAVYLGFVEEGLGTKNRIADELVRADGSSYYDTIAYDTVAMIVNDLIVGGARPVLVQPHWAIGGSEWLDHPGRIEALVAGWKRACDAAGVLWGGGETATLKDVIYPDAIELSGLGVGIIDPRERLTLGQDVREGDQIVLVESSGVHANGITLIREIAAKRLPEGYATLLPSGKTFGDAVLTPTHIYAQFTEELFSCGFTPHYMVHMTGHGWRKLMRAKGDFIYRMHTIPQPQPEFTLIQAAGNLSDADMYATYNMGAGFAVILPPEEAQELVSLAGSLGFYGSVCGVVEEGPKQVIIEPKGITYQSDSLAIR